MVHLKSTSLAVLLGSAALTSAAVLPSMQQPQARDQLATSKREWKGKLGARGPWRQENDHYLINVDLTGDGQHHNGHGDLLDINTRSLAPETEDLLRAHLKAHMERTEPIISIDLGEHHTPSDPLSDPDLAAALQTRDDRLLDLAARLISGSEKRLSARDVDLAGLEAAAKDAGVTDDQMIAAKNAVDSLTPDQKAEVENAVKHAMFAVTKPSEKRSIPGPAYLRKQRDESEALKMMMEGGKVKVIGNEAVQDTGVVSTESGEHHGAPILTQPEKRSVAEEMGGAPGYIDITSPVFNSTAQRLASLVLSTSNGTNENSTFVLNASSSVRTQVFLVPLNTTDSDPKPKEGDMIKVNLKVPVFVAESAAVKPFCATFDPSPEAPEPMTVEPCEEPEDERSQIFLYDPETGAVKPNWTPSEDNQQLLAKVSDSISSDAPAPTAWMMSSASSAISSALPTASVSDLPSVEVSASVSSIDPEPTPSAELNMMAASATEALPALPTESAATPSDAFVPEPLVSGLPEDDDHLEANPTDLIAEAAAISSAPSISAVPSNIPSVVPTPSASSAEPLVTAFAASHSAAHPSISASIPAPKPSHAGNNVTLMFTPSNASVQSSDDEEEGLGRRDHADDEDCEDPQEIFAFAAPEPSALPSAAAAHSAKHSLTPMPTVSAKPKAKSPKLPEGAPSPSGTDSTKVQLVQGDVQVEDIKSIAGRLRVRAMGKRQQKVMMVPGSETAPYEWTWTSVEEEEKEPEEVVKVFAALASMDGASL